MSQTEPEKWAQEGVALWPDGEDVIRARIEGQITLPKTMFAVETINRETARRVLFFHFDLSKATGLDLEARKIGSSALQTRNIGGIVIGGASAAVRLGVMAVEVALSVLGKATFHFHFASTDAQVERALAKCRDERRMRMSRSA